MRWLLLLLLASGCDRVFGVPFEPSPDARAPGDWQQVVAGDTFTCGLRGEADAGTLWCWGTSEDGALGFAGTTELLTPAPVGDARWRTISARQRHVCGIQTDRTLWCWGSNEAGGIGRAGGDQHTPLQIAGTWTAIAAGGSHTCAIRDGGEAWCWGSNFFGQLGNGGTNVTPIYEPMPVPGTMVWKSISVGGQHTCAIGQDDTLWCWGDGSYGQLGTEMSESRLTPTPVVGAARWSEVDVGDAVTCGVMLDRRARCWGTNGQGQLGNGTTTPYSRPRPVGADPADWTTLDLGAGHACGIRQDGELWCWGSNGHAQVPNDDAGPIVATPVRAGDGSNRWRAFSAGARHTCAITTDGNLFCAGSDGAGQLGLGTGGARRAPVEVPLPAAAVEIAVGGDTTCAVDGDGDVHCWGNNLHGGLGNDTEVPSDHPVQAIAPGPLSDLVMGDNDPAVSHHAWACALDDTRRRWCWGWNPFGQHGDAATPGRLVPTETTATTWSSLATGGYHQCGIKLGVPPTMACWGGNDVAQLGIGVATATPYAMEVDQGYQFARVAAGYAFTCALDAAGALSCWGYNLSHQVGDGGPMPMGALYVAAPKSIGGTYEQVVAGKAHACAIQADGVARCWGLNATGQVDDRGVPLVSHPTDIAGSWAQLALGTSHSCGIARADAALWCWGANVRGQLGVDGVAPRGPTKIDPAPWSAIAAGRIHTCGIKDGKVYCWGSNVDGQLGTGDVWSSELRWVTGSVEAKAVLQR